MSFTIVLSGPQGKLTEVHKALEDAGFTLHLDAKRKPSKHDWGHHDTPSGHVFCTVDGPDINVANAAVEEFGWRLRGHWEMSEAEEVVG